MTNPLRRATWLTLEPESQRATLIVEEDMFWWVSCYFLGGAKVWHQGTCVYIYIYIYVYVFFQESYSNEWQVLPKQFAMFQSLKVNRFESHLEMFSYTLHNVIQRKHVKPLPFLAAQDIFATRLREKIVLLERNLSKAGVVFSFGAGGSSHLHLHLWWNCGILDNPTPRSNAWPFRHKSWKAAENKSLKYLSQYFEFDTQRQLTKLEHVWNVLPQVPHLTIHHEINDRCIDSTPQNYGGSLPL